MFKKPNYDFFSLQTVGGNMLQGKMCEMLHEILRLTHNLLRLSKKTKSYEQIHGS